MHPAVLLVDSYEESRAALAQLLREAGHAVAEVSDGVQGLQAVRAFRPALVVVELWPSFSGANQMVEAMRRDPHLASIPVLVVTATPEYRSELHELACDSYLEKPCPPERLLSEIRRLLLKPQPPADLAELAELDAGPDVR